MEQTSRYLVATRLDRVSTAQTPAARIGMYRLLRAGAVLSVTVDNGSEIADHIELLEAMGIPTFFADPYSLWQRGRQERANRDLRRCWPKRSSFADLIRADRDAACVKINSRLRLCPGGYSLAEVFHDNLTRLRLPRQHPHRRTWECGLASREDIRAKLKAAPP